MLKSDLLVIHHGALGDVVTIFPAILRLKNDYRRIKILCQGNIGQLAKLLDIVDECFPLETAAFATLYSNCVDPVVKDILSDRADIVLFSRSRELQKTLSVLADKAVHRILPRPDIEQKIHVTEHVLFNLVRCGLLKATDIHAGSDLTSAEYSDRRDARYEPLKILIHPGSGSRKKCWPILNYIKVESLLASDGKRPEFILGPAEYDLAGILSSQLEHGSTIHISENLKALVELLKTAGGFIGNDSGISHLAAFLGLPTIAVFGPSDPERWRPIGRAVKIVSPALHCSPCFETGEVECEEMECFSRISPEDVLHAYYNCY